MDCKNTILPLFGHYRALQSDKSIKIMDWYFCIWFCYDRRASKDICNNNLVIFITKVWINIQIGSFYRRFIPFMMTSATTNHCFGYKGNFLPISLSLSSCDDTETDRKNAFLHSEHSCLSFSLIKEFS